MPTTVTDFSKGIQANPAFQGSFKGAKDMLNWEIDEIGRPKIRDGYVVTEEVVDLEGTHVSDNSVVIKVHYIADDPLSSFSRLYSIDREESWVYDNGRLFITGQINPRWIDIRENITHDWGLSTPNGVITAPTSPIDVFIPPADATTLEIWRFGVIYTWINTDFGIESPPSSTYITEIRSSKAAEGRGLINIGLTLEPGSQPTWANRLRFYIMINPFGTSDSAAAFDEPLGFAATFDPQGILLPNLFSTDPFFETSDILNAGYSFGLIGSREIDPFTIRHIYGFNLNLTYTKESDDDNNIIFVPRISSSSYDSILPVTNYDPPPQNLEQITLHAGRIWGYDPDTNTIRYSLSQGSRAAFDSFPGENSRLPHAIRVAENVSSKVIHIEPIPPKGGVYIFFSNAIRTITGKALLTGMFSPETPPQTDLDASGGFQGIGTLSPNSVIAFRNVVLFLGTDRTLYQLAKGSEPTDLGLNVQPFLDAIPTEQLPDVFAFGYNDMYHLILPDDGGVLRYSIKEKYWTRFDWRILSAFWSTGGIDNESILYGVKSDGALLRLYEGDTDAGDAIPWLWETNDLASDERRNFTEAFIKLSGESTRLAVSVRVEGQEVANRLFIPTPFNRYRFGFFGRGNLINMSIIGIGEPVPRFSSISL